MTNESLEEGLAIIRNTFASLANYEVIYVHTSTSRGGLFNKLSHQWYGPVRRDRYGFDAGPVLREDLSGISGKVKSFTAIHNHPFGISYVRTPPSFLDVASLSIGTERLVAEGASRGEFTLSNWGIISHYVIDEKNTWHTYWRKRSVPYKAARGNISEKDVEDFAQKMQRIYDEDILSLEELYACGIKTEDIELPPCPDSPSRSQKKEAQKVINSLIKIYRDLDLYVEKQGLAL